MSVASLWTDYSATGWKRWVSIGASAFGVALLGVVMWQFWLPIEFAPFNLLGVFLPFLTAPLVILLGLALRVNSRVGLFFNGLALAGLLGLYLPYFHPNHKPFLSESFPVVRFMTFNLRYEYYDSEYLATAILSKAVDVVVVQEVAPSVMPDLMTALEGQFPYVIPPSSLSDLALFSRYPITATGWFVPAEGGREALHAILDIDGQQWHIVAVHPWPAGLTWLGKSLIPIGLHYGNLEAQMGNVVERVRSFGGPAVVLGDFNMAEHSRAYRLLSRQLTDAFCEAGNGLGFTFPQDVWIGGWQVPGPFVRLDYIFHSTDLMTRHVVVTCSGASDHCLVTADLMLRP